MTQQDYLDWWIALPEDYSELPEPVCTLVEHILALQERVLRLPEPYNCACAFDHPADVCMVHAFRPSTDTEEQE